MHIAQINVAQSLGDRDNPVMKDFFDNIDRINTLAKSSPGFQWLYDVDQDPLNPTLFPDASTVVNYSVWSTTKELFDFTYKTAHAEIFRRRKEWFHQLMGFHMAVWYVPEGHQPSQQEAAQRLQMIQTVGPTEKAFNFKHQFTEQQYLQSIM